MDLVAGSRFELETEDYESSVIPFHQPAIVLYLYTVPPRGVEPRTFEL